MSETAATTLSYETITPEQEAQLSALMRRLAPGVVEMDSEGIQTDSIEHLYEKAVMSAELEKEDFDTGELYDLASTIANELWDSQYKAQKEDGAKDRKYVELERDVTNPARSVPYSWLNASVFKKGMRLVLREASGSRRGGRLYPAGRSRTPLKEDTDADIFRALLPHLRPVEPTIREEFSEESYDAAGVLEDLIRRGIIVRHDARQIARRLKKERTSRHH